jgi:hypothetical protein
MNKSSGMNKQSTVEDVEEDLSSIEGDLSSTASSSAGEEDVSDEHPIKIAANEAIWVKRSKFLVFFVIIGATILCAFAAYAFTSNEEAKDFEYQVSCLW